LIIGGFDIIKYTILEDICTLDVFNTKNRGHGSLSFAKSCAESGDTIKLLQAIAQDTIWVEDSLLRISADLAIHGNIIDSIVIGSKTYNPLVLIEGNASVELQQFILHSENPQNALVLKNEGSVILDNMTLEAFEAGGLVLDIDGEADLKNNTNVKIHENSWTCSDILEYEGQDYATVQVGNQCWMAENLNVGTMIDGASNQADNTVLEKYCYNNDPVNCNIYGGLYQWDEMMQYTTLESTQGVYPVGWHLPSDNEWKELEMSLGMSQLEADESGWRGTNEGSKMAGNAPLWINGMLENDPEFNISNLTVLPEGSRFPPDGAFYNQGILTTFWTSTQNGSQVWRRVLHYSTTQVSRSSFLKDFGYNVRCIKD
jgi:uncharacterized protein (TIGR02145 family)